MFGPAQLFALALLALASSCASGQSTCPTGPSLRSCGRNNPDFGGCIGRALTVDAPFLAPGLPSLGVRKIEPLAAPALTVRSAQGQTLALTSCSVAGGGKSVITAFTSNLMNRTTWDLTVPNFKLTCAYKMAAGFLGVASANSGQFTLSISNYKSHFDCVSTPVPAECGKVYGSWGGCTSQILSSSTFQPNFSGISAAQNTQVNTATLRQLLFATFAPAQATLVRDYLVEVFKYLPPADVWLPVSTSANVPFCLGPRPTKCSAATQ